eukprot:4256111-Amphidinium_carterae.1
MILLYTIAHDVLSWQSTTGIEHPDPTLQNLWCNETDRGPVFLWGDFDGPSGDGKENSETKIRSIFGIIHEFMLDRPDRSELSTAVTCAAYCDKHVQNGSGSGLDECRRAVFRVACDADYKLEFLQNVSQDDLRQRLDRVESEVQAAKNKAQAAENTAQAAENEVQAAKNKAQTAENKAQTAENKAHAAENKAQAAENKAQELQALFSKWAKILEEKGIEVPLPKEQVMATSMMWRRVGHEHSITASVSENVMHTSEANDD